MNDRGTNRPANGMVATWANEQAIREIYLRPVQMAVEQGDAHGITVAGGIDRADLRAYWARIPPPAIAILGRSKNTLQGIHSHPASAGFQLAAAETPKGFGPG